MKVYAHNSHGVDNHMEAMFCTIKWKNGILKVPMVQAVNELACEEHMSDSQIIPVPRSGVLCGRYKQAWCFIFTITYCLK
jgi:hypothetical protein